MACLERTGVGNESEHMFGEEGHKSTKIYNLVYLNLVSTVSRMLALVGCCLVYESSEPKYICMYKILPGIKEHVCKC